MYPLTTQDDEGQTRSITFAAAAVKIGRNEGDAVRLGARNVSRYQARLLREAAGLLPTPPPAPGPVQLPHPVPPPTRLVPIVRPAAAITAETLRPVRSGRLGLLTRALRGLRRSFFRRSS